MLLYTRLIISCIPPKNYHDETIKDWNNIKYYQLISYQLQFYILTCYFILD